MSGYEERLLQDQLYNNEECMKEYFDQWSDATHSTSPELSKKSLEEKSEDIEEGAESSQTPESLRLLYDGFLNNLDIHHIIALIMSCIQAKLGLPLTAEAICEAAILALVEQVGISEVEKLILDLSLIHI